MALFFRAVAAVRVTERSRVDPALAERLAALDRAAFPPRLQYPAAEYVRRGAWVALAEDGAALAGFCLGAPDAEAPDRFFLDVLAVDPARRRAGLATLLARRCLDHARGAGFAAVSVACERVSPEGIDLVAFYGRLGFRVLREEPDHVLMVAPLR